MFNVSMNKDIIHIAIEYMAIEMSTVTMAYETIIEINNLTMIRVEMTMLDMNIGEMTMRESIIEIYTIHKLIYMVETISQFF